MDRMGVRRAEMGGEGMEIVGGGGSGGMYYALWQQLLHSLSALHYQKRRSKEFHCRVGGLSKASQSTPSSLV